MVKVRGRNSNGKTVKQTAEKLARASICGRHGATLVPPRNHGKVTRLNQDIRDQPESAHVK